MLCAALLIGLVVRRDTAAFRLACTAFDRTICGSIASLRWRLVYRYMASSAHGPEQPEALDALPMALFARCPSLRLISLRGNPSVKDLAPLTTLTALRGLCIRSSQISDPQLWRHLRG